METPSELEGIGMPYVSPLYKEELLDEVIQVSDANAVWMLKKMSQEYGFLVGSTSGAVAYAAYTKGNILPKNSVIGMIFTDSGSAYLSKGFYSNKISHDYYSDSSSKASSPSSSSNSSSRASSKFSL